MATPMLALEQQAQVRGDTEPARVRYPLPVDEEQLGRARELLERQQVEGDSRNDKKPET